jgi:3-oxoacyl-[acyl-carrier protein] reductase
VTAPVALVTGGTRGIGLGIARALAADGWSLALCGMRSADEVARVVEDLKAAGAPEVAYWTADVSSREDRRRLIRGVETRFARLDALVNNAGKAPSVRADLLEASEDSFEDLLKTNLQGPYFLTQG